MTLLLLCVAWAFASAIVALLPMKKQYVPGIILLIVAPVLIVWVAIEFSWWGGALALMAFISMFRHPLRYFYYRFTGRPVKLPRDFKK